MPELISVIIPAYNAEKYIERCIRSIQNQTHRETEIIVVNDGSADATEHIGRELGLHDPRIKVISQENHGVSAARNRGLDVARGDYISFVDADDTLPPDALELLLDNMLRENADIVSGTMRAIHANGVVKEEANSIAEVWSGRTALEKSLEDNTHTYSVWGKLFRKEFVGDTRFEEGKRIHEDSFFIFLCCEKEPRMVCLNKCVYEYYVLPDSASRKAFSEKYYDILYFAARKYEIVRDSYPMYENLAQNMLMKANMAFLKIACRAQTDDAREQEEACIRQVKSKEKYFIPATEMDKRWFWLIKHNLYYGCKFCYRSKSWLKTIRNKQ